MSEGQQNRTAFTHGTLRVLINSEWKVEVIV
jgi:hypothetical protein